MQRTEVVVIANDGARSGVPAVEPVAFRQHSATEAVARETPIAREAHRTQTSRARHIRHKSVVDTVWAVEWTQRFRMYPIFHKGSTASANNTLISRRHSAHEHADLHSHDKPTSPTSSVVRSRLLMRHAQVTSRPLTATQEATVIICWRASRSRARHSRRHRVGSTS